MQNLVFSTLISHAPRTRYTVFLFRSDKVFEPLSNRNYFFKKIFCTALFYHPSLRFIGAGHLFKSFFRRYFPPGYRVLHPRVIQKSAAGRALSQRKKRDAAPAKHVCRNIRPVTVHITSQRPESHHRILRKRRSRRTEDRQAQSSALSIKKDHPFIHRTIPAPILSLGRVTNPNFS